jgi:hypothetical protein
MSDPTSPPPNSERSVTDVEPLGGADAVEKTTYVTGQGTDPHGSNHGSIPPVSQSFGSPILWITAAIAVLIVIAYAVGFLS